MLRYLFPLAVFCFIALDSASAFLLINADEDTYLIELTIGDQKPIVETLFLEPGELVEYDCEGLCILHLPNGVTQELSVNDVLIIRNGDIMIQSEPEAALPQT